MANKFNTKLSLLLLITLSLVLIIPSHCYKDEEEETSAEEELFGCFLKCDKKQQHNNERELTECEQKCVDHYQQRKKEEREEGGELYPQIEEPEKIYEQCRSTCDKTKCTTTRQCRKMCKHQYEEQKKQQEEQRGGGSTDVTNPKKEREEDEKQETQNPYFFESQRFDSKYKTEEGHIRVLERFSKKSKLLQGIENYRLAILEANPNTFVVPHHCDTESVFVVVGGKGTISYVWKNQRQTFDLEHGDVIRVPAGSIVYLVNRDDNEKLRVLKLLQPVNTPGRFKEYFGAGGENPESFYRAFSNEVLEAAFNAPREKLERIFGQQQKGVIIKASKEQIKALSKKSESSKGKKEESWGPFNLLKERPLASGQFGHFILATPNDHDQLKDMDVSVAYMNIKKGGMVAPYYNSKSTKMVLVVGGSGQFEMACPHLSEQRQQSSRGRKEMQETRSDIQYQKVSAHLSVGDVFIIPAGHPVTMIASQDSNLQLVGFGNKAVDNNIYFLAGKENVWNYVQSEAKELAFKLPAREVEEILGSQEESYFMAGPGQREEGRGHHMSSILDFVGF